MILKCIAIGSLMNRCEHLAQVQGRWWNFRLARKKISNLFDVREKVAWSEKLKKSTCTCSATFRVNIQQLTVSSANSPLVLQNSFVVLNSYENILPSFNDVPSKMSNVFECNLYKMTFINGRLMVFSSRSTFAQWIKILFHNERHVQSTWL